MPRSRPAPSNARQYNIRLWTECEHFRQMSLKCIRAICDLCGLLNYRRGSKRCPNRILTRILGDAPFVMWTNMQDFVIWTQFGGWIVGKSVRIPDMPPHNAANEARRAKIDEPKRASNCAERAHEIRKCVYRACAITNGLCDYDAFPCYLARINNRKKRKENKLRRDSPMEAHSARTLHNDTAKQKEDRECARSTQMPAQKWKITQDCCLVVRLILSRAHNLCASAFGGLWSIFVRFWILLSSFIILHVFEFECVRFFSRIVRKTDSSVRVPSEDFYPNQIFCNIHASKIPSFAHSVSIVSICCVCWAENLCVNSRHTNSIDQTDQYILAFYKQTNVLWINKRVQWNELNICMTDEQCRGFFCSVMTWG